MADTLSAREDRKVHSADSAYSNDDETDTDDSEYERQQHQHQHQQQRKSQQQPQAPFPPPSSSSGSGTVVAQPPKVSPPPGRLAAGNVQLAPIAKPPQQQQQPSTAPASTTSTSSGISGATSSNSRKKRKKLPTKKVINISFTKYPIIRELADEFGFTTDPIEEELEHFEFNLIWSDTVLPLQKLVRLSNWQRSNHFPSMHLLCRKVHLGLTLGRMRKVFPQHYNFFPRTWSLRSERQQFARYFNSLPAKKAFILKPNAGCQGRGIVLSRDPLNAVEDLDNFVVQEYVSRPLLIDNKKFDLRVYVLVTSIRHLSIFVFNDGLVRMCAEDYEKPNDENMSNPCKHLTNYAVNKHNDQFVFNSDAEGRGDTGNKRDFRWLNRWLNEMGHSSDKFWERVHHMVVKTIISAQPQMNHVYNSCFPHSNDGYTCFELLGFDILVDERVRPWLMEVNHTPSFTCDTPLDRRIKHSVIGETWRIIDVQPTDKMRHLEREKAQFAKRMQQVRSNGAAAQAAAAAAAAAGGGGASSSMGGTPSSVMLPIDSMLSTAQVNAQDQLLAAIENEALLTQEQLAEDHRRKEDSKLKNFKRVYPSRIIEKQALYETILAAAKAASAVQTTASQEQRQNEVRAERERRESTKRPLLGTPAAATSSSSSSYQPTSGFSAQLQQQIDSGRRPAPRNLGSAGSGSGSGVAPQPPSMPNSGNTSPNSMSDDVAPSQPFVRSSLAAGRVPGPSSSSSSGAAAAAAAGGRQQRTASTTATATPPAPPTSLADRPKRTKEEVEKQRQKLAEQVERHRRRMVLGPRLSVFQLREAQLASMFDDDGTFAGAGAAGAGGAGSGVYASMGAGPSGGIHVHGFGLPPHNPLLAHGGNNNGVNNGGGLSSRDPNHSQRSGGGGGGVPPAAGVGGFFPTTGAGVSTHPTANANGTPLSHHEQFQAILQQLSRYQHVLPEYQFSNDRTHSHSVRHHEGFDLGDEDDDDVDGMYGVGCGGYYGRDEEEEEEE